ncbi:VWA domain-containing protein [Thioalkalivibrio sp. ALMg11]|uniref:VWA domain-containing protein n=1 Tax=Thioalkalivibrio sp. ALMg11 TaxID=1158165 RepID=UPI0003AB27B5|nr:VWA domain-containing protein [Thioalkalivibrio sp. ALMg11]
MTFEFGKSRLLVPALLAASIGLSGCGGGGGGTTPSAGITVVPDRFNFGTITEGNENHVLPRQFIIRNEGTTSQSISSMSLFGRDPGQFVLDDSGGNAPCGAPPFDLPGGGSCTVVAEFKPARIGEFEALLIAESDDPNTPTVGGTLEGTYEPIKSIHVNVNQVNACAFPPKAFVSVTDQADFPIPNLVAGDFTLAGFAPGSYDVQPISRNYTDLSLSITMDYSGSITDFPDAVDNMEAGATSLVVAMQDKDEADIIKYADDVQPMTTDGFTSVKGDLEAAIKNPPDLGRDTAFYGATEEAIARFDIPGSNNDRKAVIALTDGEDTVVEDTEAALHDTIGQAVEEDIPVFTIGFGEFLQEAQKNELQRLADGTGGLFYQPASDANLQQAFLQVALLLFEYQYVIEFDNLSDKEGTKLEVTVAYAGVEDATGTKTIQACSGP